MKKYIIKVGGVIASLAMFLPAIVLSQYNKLETLDFWFYLISSICYDFYMYSIISKENNNEKEHYYKFVKDTDKKLHLDVSYEEKFKLLEDYIEQLLDKYF